ncbi:MAG: hypothetical protein R3304_13250 [Longimicrobiales bacterium]|nr:hypothetical protein [Longimicrobiales bacterium]
MTTTHEVSLGHLFTRCLFCHAPFPENGMLHRMPRGRKIAYDPVRGRLWAVCHRCHRWNLAPIEEREAALYELERTARDLARPLVTTANVSLLGVGPMTLVRVGAAGLVEQSWWRYGRELRRRKAAYESPRSKLSAYTFGLLQYLGDAMGFSDGDVAIDWEDTPVADVLRWRRFGWAAWHGRETCPYCNSTLRALRYDLGWWVYPIDGADGRIGIGIPCQRCDPWTPDKVYELHGDVAENVLRRLLAYQNIAGASEDRITDAARRIEEAGSAGAFAERVSRQRETLWRLGSTGTVGLEIALNEAVERRLLQMEARALEFFWKREEELARIIDEELTPRKLLEAHLRRLPVRVRARSSVLRRRPEGLVGRILAGEPVRPGKV